MGKITIELVSRKTVDHRDNPWAFRKVVDYQSIADSSIIEYNGTYYVYEAGRSIRVPRFV